MSDFMQDPLSSIRDVGFTGTRRGLISPQRHTLVEILHEIPVPERVHHGDCVGADAEFHHLVRLCMPTIHIRIHPPIDNKHRAYMKGDSWEDPREYIERNHRIVNSCQLLIATPDGKERNRSGTWATIRYARKRGIERKIIMPDGSIDPDA